MLKVAGTILIWIAVIGFVIVGGFFVYAFFTVQDNAESLGWLLIIAGMLGIPLLVIGAIVLLIGSVLVTSKRTTMKQKADPNDFLIMPDGEAVPRTGFKAALVQATEARATRSYNDPLRAAMLGSETRSKSQMNILVIGLRVMAVALFAWLFLPELFLSIHLVRITGNSFGPLMLMIMPRFFFSLIVPLILWLVSNVLRNRSAASQPTLSPL